MGAAGTHQLFAFHRHAFTEMVSLFNTIEIAHGTLSHQKSHPSKIVGLDSFAFEFLPAIG